MAVVWIPSLLQDLTGGAEKVTVLGKTLRQVLDNLDALCPGIKVALLEEDGGGIKPGIAVVVDGTVSHLGLISPVEDDSEIHFIPAISGG